MAAHLDKMVLAIRADLEQVIPSIEQIMYICEPKPAMAVKSSQCTLTITKVVFSDVIVTGILRMEHFET